MKVLILGVGQVGYNIAKHMISPENHVTVVDHDENKLNMVSNNLDVQPILGHASFPDVLEKAGAREADLLIAATNLDEVNMIACEIVHSLFNIEMKIARVRQQKYLDPKYKSLLFQPKNLSIDFIISPEVEIAKSINRSIQLGSASTVIDVWGDVAKLLSVRCMEFSPIVNTPLRLLPSLFPSLEISVVALQRQNGTIIPSKNDIILANDQVYFIIPSEQVFEAMNAFGYTEQSHRQVTIVGCGNIGRTLAQEIELSQPDVQIKIIEKGLGNSEIGTRILKNSEVLIGDALNVEILEEAGIRDCDTFISVTNDDNTNIVSSLLAKNNGAKRVISLLNNMANSQFVQSLGVDSIINPNAITVSTILKAVRQHRMRSLYTIDGGIEVVEAEISETSNIVGLSIDDVIIQGQVFVAALKREDQLFVYPESFTICTGDRLIIVVKKDTVHKIEKILSGRSFYT